LRFAPQRPIIMVHLPYGAPLAGSKPWAQGILPDRNQGATRDRPHNPRPFAATKAARGTQRTNMC
jgi:hypothetical protein